MLSFIKRMFSSSQKATQVESKKSIAQPLNVTPYFVSTVVKKHMNTVKHMIRGPGNIPVSLSLRYKHPTFTLFDDKTEGGVKLSHPYASEAIGIDDQIFASASSCSVKIWRFDNLELIKEYKLFNEPRQHTLYRYHGKIRSMQLLPEQRFLIGFTSTAIVKDYGRKSYGCIWVVDVDKGLKYFFDLNSFAGFGELADAGCFVAYKIAIIPNAPQRFILYDKIWGESIFVFEINFEKNELNLIVSHKNLSEGTFQDLKVSADGKYWAAVLNYYEAVPAFGIQVYQVDKNYNLKCIAKMFNANAPQWNGDKLLYSFEGKILEFDPENRTHLILTNRLVVNDKVDGVHASDAAYYDSAIIFPCTRLGFFQVIRPGHWQTYSQELNIVLQAELQANLIPSVVNIVNEYLDIARPKLTVEFENTLYTKPSKNG